MASHPLFSGLVIDEFDRALEVAFVGGEAFYVVDDDGFRRHVESEHVDRGYGKVKRLFDMQERAEQEMA